MRCKPDMGSSRQPGLMGYNGGHGSSSLFLAFLAPYAQERAGMGRCNADTSGGGYSKASGCS